MIPVDGALGAFPCEILASGKILGSVGIFPTMWVVPRPKRITVNSALNSVISYGKMGGRRGRRITSEQPSHF